MGCKRCIGAALGGFAKTCSAEGRDLSVSVAIEWESPHASVAKMETMYLIDSMFGQDDIGHGVDNGWRKQRVDDQWVVVCLN
jgi:hypothetical protein